MKVQKKYGMRNKQIKGKDIQRHQNVVQGKEGTTRTLACFVERVQAFPRHTEIECTL